MAKIPGEDKAVDGVSKVPGRQIERYVDWAVLKREFVIQADYASPYEWLRDVKGWPQAKYYSGNTKENVKDWKDDRGQVQDKITEAAIRQAVQEERKRIPDLRKAKAMLIAGVIKDIGDWHRLGPSDKKLCYEILKVELQEPTNVKDLAPAGAQDPVEALLSEYGLIADGKVVIDDDPESDEELVGGSDSEEAAATDSGTPQEVSQD